MAARELGQGGGCGGGGFRRRGRGHRDHRARPGCHGPAARKSARRRGGRQHPRGRARLSECLRRGQGHHLSRSDERPLHGAARNGACMGGRVEPQQRLAREHRRRPAGAPVSARGHRVSELARGGLRAQVSSRRHPRLFQYMEVSRTRGERAGNRYPLRGSGARADSGRHHQGNSRHPRRAQRKAVLRQGAQGGYPHLRRIREQSRDDQELPARSSLLLHLRHALQRGRWHHHGTVGGGRPVAHEQLRRPVDGAQGARIQDDVFNDAAAFQPRTARWHDRRRS